MARTRSTKATGAEAETKVKTGASTSAGSSTATYKLPEATKNPPRVFILPKKATSDARIVTLQNPRYSKPTRYLVCPEAGFFEFTKIAAPKTTPRSWLLEGKSSPETENGTKSETQVTKGADLYIATAIDPLFLILPALVAQDSADKKRMFLSSDDYFDSISEIPDSIDSHNHLSEILSWPKTRALLESRMASVCDTVSAGDEQMFRLNESKLLSEILSKARRMAEHGLPKSMVDKFVTKALEAPILSVRSTQAAPTTSTEETVSSGTTTPLLESTDSQSTISSVETSSTGVSEASTAATSMSESTQEVSVTSAITVSPEVLSLQRLRVSLDFICSSYLPPSLSKNLKTQLSSSSANEAIFKPLDEYMSKLAELRQKAAAARATTDYSRKRTRDEEDDERAEKKRKKDEEEKAKKANMSRGVRELKKVNTTGMKKLSEFFKKKA